MADSSLWGNEILEVQIPGPPGPTGPAPELEIGTVTVGTANVVITEISAGVYELDFTVPTGPQGAEGPPGQGAGFSSVVVTTLPSGSPASGSVSGTAPNYTLELSIPAGPAGDTGPPGLPGPSTAILSGAGAPSTSIGDNGDFYVDLADGRFYGPKEADVWPTSYISIKGEKGDQGDPGVPGVVQEIVAGDGIEVDSSDPANPEVSVKISTDSDNILEVSANDQGLYVPVTEQNFTEAQKIAVAALVSGTSTLEDVIAALQAT